MNYDVVIAGGGVLGLSAAFHLSGMKQKVLLLEREQLPGTHASGKNAGMFRQLYRNEKLTEWAERSRLGWPEQLRNDCFRQTGSIISGRKPPNHHRHLFAERIVRTRRCGETTAVPAVYSATDGLLDSPLYVNGLFKLCRERGTDIRLCEALRSIELSGDGFDGETATGFRFSAPRLVDASGAWLSQALEQSSPAFRVEARAYARHLFVVEGFPESYMPEERCGFYWDEANGWYLRLWGKTSRLVSICDVTPADPDSFAPGADVPERVGEKLLDAIPEVASTLSIARAWHCFRTYTADQLPIVGEDSTRPGLFWLGAFGGFGMSTSFAAAEDLALAICGKEVEIPKEFSAQRTKPSTDTTFRASTVNE